MATIPSITTPPAPYGYPAAGAPSFIGPVPTRQGKVLGASTVRRYTPPKPAAPAPAAPSLPPPTLPVPQTSVSAPVASPVVAPPADYTDPVTEYYKNLDQTPPTAADEATIKENARKDMQAYIDAINNQYANLTNTEQQAGQGRLGQTRAINAKSGLLGSDFGNANQDQTQKYNEQNLKALEDEKQLKLTEVQGKIDQRARDEIAAKKAEALGNAQAYIKKLDENQTSARADLKTIAQAGVKLDGTKKQVLQKQTGYDPLTFESIYAANQPVPEYFSPIETKSGELIVVSKTGEVKNLGKYDLPADYTLTFQPGTGIPFVYNKATGEFKAASEYYVPKAPKTPTDTRTASEKEYEYAKEQGFNGSFVDYQAKVKALPTAAQADNSNPFGN